MDRRVLYNVTYSSPILADMGNDHSVWIVKRKFVAKVCPLPGVGTEETVCRLLSG